MSELRSRTSGSVLGTFLCRLVPRLLAWYLHRRWRTKTAWRHPSPPRDYGNHVPPRSLSRYQQAVSR